MDHDKASTTSEGSVSGAWSDSSSDKTLSLGQTTPEIDKFAMPFNLDLELPELFDESAAAKIWRVAEAYLAENPGLETYPEYVPSDGNAAGTYESKPAAFWTCGFFPASLYCILERSMKYPQYLPRPTSVTAESFHDQLLGLCRSWSTPLRANATRTNTHDLGFIMRSLRMDWELTGNMESLRSYVTAAESLTSRYDEKVHAIRSWDKTLSHAYEIIDKEKNFVIIVDSMCNMDLLFYAAHISSNPKLSSIATAHAHTVLRTLVRGDNSTWHVANLNPNNGSVQFNMTHQGYSNDSTWSRGQAWAILGFAQTYGWTSDPTFLSSTQRFADYFLARLAESPAPTHKNVPLWDFDAPPNEDMDTEGQPLRDSSAGLIAANGLLLLHQALQRQTPAKSSPYLEAALRIASDTVGYCLDRGDVASFEVNDEGKVRVAPGTWDAILKHATANNNKDAFVRYRDSGLVYADYYYLEFGNKLLRMGLV